MIYFLFPMAFAAPQKHALIIGVSEYKSPFISTLQSNNDILVLEETMKQIGIPENNITTIGKKKATRDGIINAWNTLQENVKPGDFVYIHYSGHGSQVPDESGDEWEDGLDEVWVPYDAIYKSKQLDPKSVILDDEVETMHKRLRSTLGLSGQLFMTTDSCHNATITRSLDDPEGISRSLETDYPNIKIPPRPTESPKDTFIELAPIISISASSP